MPLKTAGNSNPLIDRVKSEQQFNGRGVPVRYLLGFKADSNDSFEHKCRPAV